MAAALLVGAQWWPGWQLDSNAEQAKTSAVEQAYVATYANVCIGRYKADATPAQRLEFAKVDRWDRDGFIKKAGFATPKGFEAPIGVVADKCASVLGDELEKAAEKAKQAQKG
jgi:hypothetical protein